MEPLLNLRDLLQHEIEDLYSAEEQIIEAIPKMVDKASNRQLKEALTEHLKITRAQKTRLDKVQKLLNKESGEENKKRTGFLERMFGSGTKCKGTEGLIKEGEKMMGEDMDTSVMDAAIIASAQKIEHYEISGYGTAKAYAIQLGLDEVANLLETTLNEEYKSDDMLTALAIGKVNVQAEKGQNQNKITTGKAANSSNKGSSSAMNSNPPAKRAAKAAAKKGSSSTKTASKKAAQKKSSSKKSK